MDIKEKVVRKDIEERRKFVSKVEDLCEVVRKFDGKIFNKRLETAMKEIYPTKIEQEYFWKSISITFFIQDRVVFSDETNRFGSHDVEYIKDHHFYVGMIQDAYDDDKRIVAEKIIAKIRATADYYAKTADEMEEQLGRIDEIVAECKRINAEKQRFNHDINCMIRDYYDLKV